MAANDIHQPMAFPSHHHHHSRQQAAYRWSDLISPLLPELLGSKNAQL